MAPREICHKTYRRSRGRFRERASDGRAVEKGRISLEGSVEWDYQRSIVEHFVRGLEGVRGVANLIDISPKSCHSKSSARSRKRRNAKFDAKRVSVQAFGSEVNLTGIVSSCAAREEAERRAWVCSGRVKGRKSIKVSA
jgi:osmotically-inducible protein OsmY